MYQIPKEYDKELVFLLCSIWLDPLFLVFTHCASTSKRWVFKLSSDHAIHHTLTYVSQYMGTPWSGPQSFCSKTRVIFSSREKETCFIQRSLRSMRIKISTRQESSTYHIIFEEFTPCWKDELQLKEKRAGASEHDINK